MKKNNNNLMLLFMFFGVALVIANIIAPKLFLTGVTLFGRSVALTSGIIVFPVTFLITDIIGEVWGKEEAQRLVIFGFIVQLFASVVILIAQLLPALSPDMQNAYMTVLGLNWLIMLGSLTAYSISQTWDVYVFNRVRNYFMARTGNRQLRFLWNNISTLSSQLIDSTVFITIVFGFGFGWLFDPAFGIIAVILQITTQYIFKLFFALLDTPLFYFFTRNVE